MDASGAYNRALGEPLADPRTPSPRDAVSTPPYRRAVVVGVGLIGGSVALALREKRLAERVVGVVRAADRVKRVTDCGVVDEATADLAAACTGADLVVVTTPVGSIAEHVVAAARHAAAEALITDAGSTKAGVVADVAGAWPADSEAHFVGAHPLAGDHRSGPEAARGDLFDGATTLVTPTEATPAEALARARRFWEAIGSKVIEQTPAEHDRLVALASHVPHLAASAVAATTPDEALPLVATGWADTTRVAAGSPELWREIVLANSGPVAEGARRLAAELTAYAVALDAADGDALLQMLEEGRRRRDALGS